MSRGEYEMAGNLKITLKKSPIGRTEKHRSVLVGLGLTKVNKTVVRMDTPEIRGMVNKVSYLLSVEPE
jgi:large subunit ribosomal protein L30